MRTANNKSDYKIGTFNNNLLSDRSRGQMQTQVTSARGFSGNQKVRNVMSAKGRQQFSRKFDIRQQLGRSGMIEPPLGGW
jgi:hypothetical protein